MFDAHYASRVSFRRGEARGKVVKHGALTMIYRDGKLCEVYSYDTCMLCTLPNGTQIFNGTKYSSTTSKQMSRYVYGNIDCQAAIPVYNIEKGAEPRDLINALGENLTTEVG